MKALLICLMVLLQLLTADGMAIAEDAVSKTLVVGSEQDYPPFAVGKTDADAGGFTVDLWKAVAREAGLNYTIRVRPFHEILQEFKEGKIDVLINLAQSDERRQFVDFSIPHVTVNGAIFVRKGTFSIRSEADFAGKSIIVLNADLAHDYALARGWGKQLVLTDTAAEGFRLLSSGKHDAMLISKLAGMQTLHELKISNIKPLDAKAGFSQKFSFAVHKGDSTLLARVNEALSLTKPSGDYDALYEKWFGVYEEKRLTLWDALVYLAPIGLILLGFAGYEFHRRQLEHRFSQEALRQSESRFRSMLETSPIAVRIKKTKGQNVVFCNRRYEELINCKPGQGIGVDPKVYYARPEDYREIRLTLGSGEQILNRLVEFDIPGGGTKWTLASYFPIQYEGEGAVLGWFYDITERKSIEAELILYRDHLEELIEARTSELVKAQLEAERANKAKSLFLANMTHELRTPMHAILSFSQLGQEKTALSEVPVAKLREYFDYIANSGERLLALLNELLDLSKLESGKMVMQSNRHDMVKLVRKSVDELAILAQKKEIAIDVGDMPPDLSVRCDGSRIGQVIDNLLSNAIKFSPPSSTIRISVSRTELPGRRAGDERRSGVIVKVQDEGVGIPPDELEDIFDEFVQSSKTANGSGGTGLGLSICRQIVVLHGGSICAENNPDRGASLIFTLPIELSEKTEEGL